MNPLFLEASYVLEKIENEGFKAYFVGGCVRDHCLNRPIKDIDIASSATPEDIQRIFPKTIPVGIEHGTVIVRHNHVSYEVTTFRKEDKYEDFRRPSRVWFVTELQEDLSRRDFTFNAMAMDKSYQLIDPFDGQADLNKRQIRTVGDPNARFSEDPLRLMRACRFMSVYSMEIEDETKAAILKNAHLLKRISTERVTEEFRKLLAGEMAGKALAFMKKTKIFDYLPYPLTEEKEDSMLIFPWSKLQTEEQRWAAVMVLSQINNQREFLKTWKLPNTVIRNVLEILSAFYIVQWTKTDIYKTGLKTALLGLELKCLINGGSYNEQAKNLEQLALEIPIRSKNEIPINGEDVLRIKEEAPGVWVGKLFLDMEEAIVKGELSLSEEKLIEWVRRWEEK